jgi:hypothetical protein
MSEQIDRMMRRETIDGHHEQLRREWKSSSEERRREIEDLAANLQAERDALAGHQTRRAA